MRNLKYPSGLSHRQSPGRPLTQARHLVPPARPPAPLTGGHLTGSSPRPPPRSLGFRPTHSCRARGSLPALGAVGPEAVVGLVRVPPRQPDQQRHPPCQKGCFLHEPRVRCPSSFLPGLEAGSPTPRCPGLPSSRDLRGQPFLPAPDPGSARRPWACGRTPPASASVFTCLGPCVSSPFLLKTLVIGFKTHLE